MAFPFADESDRGSSWSLNSSAYDSGSESLTDSYWMGDSGAESPIGPPRKMQLRRDSTLLIDRLLSEIYYGPFGRGSSSSGGARSRDAYITECSPDSNAVVGSSDAEEAFGSCEYLAKLGVRELEVIARRTRQQIAQTSAKLVSLLKQKDKAQAKVERNSQVLTAVLRAESARNGHAELAESKMRFSVCPTSGKKGYQQWLVAIKAMTRHPLGLPSQWRNEVWLSLADHELEGVDWPSVVRFSFNDHINPDDENLGIQIVKDLNRTGYSGYDREEDRASLKRVLLAYARWNKAVGYCQGFNILAALLLQVMEGSEEATLKMMIYIIDHILPTHYFANNLRALSVDMAVLCDLMKIHLPDLAAHLDTLRTGVASENGDDDAETKTTDAYEPPLTNVFTVQWFLTVFAICLPPDCVMRVWDAVLVDGSEVVIRAALAVWKILMPRLLTTQNADEFYTVMGELTPQLPRGSVVTTDEFTKTLYGLAEFPFPTLMELREKYTYTISPFPDRPLRRNSAGNSGDHAGMMGCIYSLMPYLPLWRMRRLFTDPSLLFNDDDDDESDDKDSKRRLSTMQRSYRNIQRHQKKSFIVVSSGRKTPPSPPSRFGDRSPVNGNRPAGLHLVSPEVLKPLPRPKRQPSGHHSPFKSKLLTLSPLAAVKRPASASRNTIPLNITDPEAGIVSSPALNHLTDFLPSSGDDDDESTTRPRPSPLPLTLSTLPEEPSPTENGDSSVQRVQAIVHSLPTESRRSPSAESGSRSSVTPPPPPPLRTSRASIDTKTASELAVTVASSPVVVVVTETVPASSSHSVRFSAPPPPPPPLPSRPPSSPHRVSTLVTTADDDAAAQEAARDAYLATRPDLLVTLATDLPPPSLSNRNKAPAKITPEAISSVASAIAGSQKESRNLVPPTT